MSVETTGTVSPTCPTETAVQLSDVSFGYDRRRPILRGIDMTIARGKLTAIMGGSGCGKTTILRLIGGQLRPQRGRVVVAGKDVAALDRDELFALRRKIGMLFQFGALFTDMTVFENIAFPLREHTELPEELIRKLNDALGITSVVVTHDIYESLKIVDYIYFVAEGRIVAHGTPEDVRASTDPFVRQFVDGQADGPVPFHVAAAPLEASFGVHAGR